MRAILKQGPEHGSVCMCVTRNSITTLAMIRCSPEERDSMLLRNVYVYLRAYMASQQRITSIYNRIYIWEVFTVANMNMTEMWDFAPCNFIEVDSKSGRFSPRVRDNMARYLITLSPSNLYLI